MSELQKIAVGLLGLSHPEIHRSRNPPAQPALPTAAPTRGATALRGLKFAVAALFAGARAIPLGDNGRVTRKLGEYGAHLKGC
jgi:hypothetical protein